MSKPRYLDLTFRIFEYTLIVYSILMYELYDINKDFCELLKLNLMFIKFVLSYGLSIFNVFTG